MEAMQQEPKIITNFLTDEQDWSITVGMLSA